MTAPYLGFFSTLRDYGVDVSMRHVLEYTEALKRGLGGGLDRLYTLLRLICVKRLEDIDAFERAFAHYFLALDLPPPGEPLDLNRLLESKPFKEWLERELEERGLSLSDIRWRASADELLQRFLETVAAQMGEHHGGGRWVGTGGYSPFGHSGHAKRGFRVGGDAAHFSAIKVLGERRYANYSPESTLKAENIRQTLESLKRLVPAGPKSELDLDATIARTAKNAGEIELVFQRELRDKISVILLIDNGGRSMTRFVPIVRTVFSKMHARFKDIETYFFHNCIYSHIYRDAKRRNALPLETVLESSPRTRLFIIGDAAMAPEELLNPYGAISYDNYDHVPAIESLQRVRAAFPHSVWLNPIPKEAWEHHRGWFTIARIGELFPMEELSLRGLRNAVEYLAAGER